MNSVKGLQIDHNPVDPATKLVVSSMPWTTMPIHNQVLTVDGNDDISCEAIGGTTGQSLLQNFSYLSQITENIHAYHILPQ